MPQLVDFNQAVVSCVFVAQTLDKDPTIPMIRNLLMNSFVSWNAKFREQYGNIVICCDDKHSWRKDVFAFYKAKRKSNRASSPVRWDLVFESIDTFKQEISNYLPYKVISVDRAEGDDIIASIVKYHQQNEFVSRGLVEEPQPVMIISTDTDFIQLHQYPNVKQWAQRQKKFVSHSDPVGYLKEKIIKGDSGDGVPSVLADDDVLVTPGKRSPPMRADRLEKLIGSTVDELDEVTRRNYFRNKKMIDLIEGIPNEIEQEIVSKYTTVKPASSMRIMSYLIEHQMKNLTENANFL